MGLGYPSSKVSPCSILMFFFSLGVLLHLYGFDMVNNKIFICQIIIIIIIIIILTIIMGRVPVRTVKRANLVICWQKRITIFFLNFYG